MRIVVFGAGAMGKLLAALLSQSPHEVWLFCRREEQAVALREKGIRLSFADGRPARTLAVRATADPRKAAGADLVVLTVKSHQTREAIPAIRQLLGSQGILLTLQNGVGNVETLAESLPAEGIWAGTTTQGATSLSDTEVRHAGEGVTCIGSPAVPHDPRLPEVAGILNDWGIAAEVSRNIEERLWAKLLINAAINPLTALLEVPNGRLVEDAHLVSVMDQAAEEVVALARRMGLNLSLADPREAVREVCRKTAANRSSMLQDILAGRRTEVEAINGAVVRFAREKGLAVPVNETLYRLVKAKEAG